MSNQVPEDSARPWRKFYPATVRAKLPPPTYTSLVQQITDASQKYSSQIAFTTCMPNGMFGSLTYQEVDRLSDNLAAYLRECVGLKKGDRVAIQMPNCLAYPLAVFGILKAGGVIVNTNPLYTPTEMIHQFRDSGAEVLIAVDLLGDKLGEVIGKTSIRKVLIASIVDFFPPITARVAKTVLKYWNRLTPKCSVEFVAFTEAIKLGQTYALSEKIANYSKNIGHQDTAALQYTGGTTGVSKGAILSHGNILNNIEQVLELVSVHTEQGKECILTALPLYHIFAFSVNLLTFHRVGARNILTPNPRPISNIQRAIENYNITWITGVNTLFNTLLQEEWFYETPPKHLKVSAAGGTSLHQSVAERWLEVTKTSIFEGYGLTESSPGLTFNPFGGMIKSETIGIPLPETDIRIVDDQGKPVAIGESGELIAKGPQIMQGYWQRPEETADAIRDGWLYTGDIATMDADGYFKIVDRKKDIILVSGFNVYPNEVEECLALHPEVLETAVIGVDHAASGEAVKAFVVRKNHKLTADELLIHCRKHLTGYKIPKSIEFRDELPKSSVGKILRKDLRAEFSIKKGA